MVGLDRQERVLGTFRFLRMEWLVRLVGTFGAERVQRAVRAIGVLRMVGMERTSWQRRCWANRAGPFWMELLRIPYMGLWIRWYLWHMGFHPRRQCGQLDV